MMTALHKFYSEEELLSFAKEQQSPPIYLVYIRVEEEDYNKFVSVWNKCDYRFSNIMIDVPNGYIKKFYEFVKRFRDKFPKVILGAGNVVTGEAVNDLILDCGVDFVKCGIASGGLCASYDQTGVFYPQLSVCVECSDIAHGLGAHIISDGSVQTVGDFAKGFCANADIMMAGSFFCGSRECNGEWTEQYDYTNHPLTASYFPPTRKFFRAYGMSSDIAINKYYNGQGLNEYRSSEGKVQIFPDKGPVENIAYNIIGGLKSTGSYIGAEEIRQFGKCATFIKI